MEGVREQRKPLLETGALTGRNGGEGGCGGDRL